MNAIAAQLDDAEIENLAAHFAGLPGAAPEAVGTMSAALAGTRPHFPAAYADSFTRYHTIDFPDRNQVRHYWANEAALQAARAGEPFPPGAYLFVEIHKAELDASGAPAKGADGRFVQGELSGCCGPGPRLERRVSGGRRGRGRPSGGARARDGWPVRLLGCFAPRYRRAPRLCRHVE